MPASARKLAGARARRALGTRPRHRLPSWWQLYPAAGASRAGPFPRLVQLPRPAGPGTATCPGPSLPGPPDITGTCQEDVMDAADRPLVPATRSAPAARRPAPAHVCGGACRDPCSGSSAGPAGHSHGRAQRPDRPPRWSGQPGKARATRRSGRSPTDLSPRIIRCEAETVEMGRANTHRRSDARARTRVGTRPWSARRDGGPATRRRARQVTDRRAVLGLPCHQEQRSGGDTGYPDASGRSGAPDQFSHRPVTHRA